MPSAAALWHGPQEPLAQAGSYEVSVATTLVAVRACQGLRYDVFNTELNEGLESSHALRLDRDRFDVICDHLMVRDTETGDVVGTYRMQTGYRAKGNAGYYSEQFFDFAPFESIRGQLLELGRACVHRDHRDASVLMLLWKGIFRYARQSSARFLIGCSSLTSQNPAEGTALYAKLRDRYLAPEQMRTMPLVDRALPRTDVVTGPVRVPRLLRTYLELSAKICGPPAIDREFGTIDLLTILDLEEISSGLRARVSAE
jgi:putative hemolysin